MIQVKSVDERLTFHRRIGTQDEIPHPNFENTKK
jgi:hypothetical protein